MNNIIHSNKLEVRINNKGKAIYSSHPIKSSVIIERVPVILFDNATSRLFRKSDQGARFLAWHVNGDIVETYATACGLLMLCNHSEQPNCMLQKELTLEKISLTSTREIKKGEELTIKYFSFTDNNHD